MRRMSRLVAVGLAAVLVVNIYMTPRANAAVAETSAAQSLAAVVLMYMTVSGISTAVESMGGVAVADVVSTSVISSYAASIGSSVSSLAASILPSVTLTGVGTIAIGAAAALALGGLAAYIVNQYQLDQANQASIVWADTSYALFDGSLVSPTIASDWVVDSSFNAYGTNVLSIPAIDVSDYLADFADSTSSFWSEFPGDVNPGTQVFYPLFTIASTSSKSLVFGVLCTTYPNEKDCYLTVRLMQGSSVLYTYTGSMFFYLLRDSVVYVNSSNGFTLSDSLALTPENHYLYYRYDPSSGYVFISTPRLLAKSGSPQYKFYASGPTFSNSSGNIRDSAVFPVSSSLSYVGSSSGEYEFPSESLAIDPGFTVSDGATVDDILDDVLTEVASNTFAPTIVVPGEDVTTDWDEVPVVDDAYADSSVTDSDYPSANPDPSGLIPGDIFSGFWHYVLELLSFARDGLAVIGQVFDALPYALKVVYYAIITCVLVFGLLSRLLM